MTIDFYRVRLDQMIDLRHPLAVLSEQIAWARLESSLAPMFARTSASGKPGNRAQGQDLFGDGCWLV